MEVELIRKKIEKKTVVNEPNIKENQVVKAVLPKNIKKGEKAEKTRKTEVVKKPKNSNDITDIIDPNTVDEVMATILTTSNDERRDKFILYWLLGYNMKTAALAAGYKQSYAESGIQKAMRDSPILRERIEKITSVMPEKYKALCRMRLPDVAEVEGGVIKLMKDDPEMAMKHPQVLKQMKQAAGVLVDEVIPLQPVSIKTLKILQNISLVKCESRLKELEDKEKAIDVTPSQDKE